MSDLEIGQMAPDFNLPTNGEGQFCLSEQRGKKVVVYFYPKDNTPGCTTQAIGFTEHLAEFTEANTVIIGISKDSVRKHDNFVSKKDLTITLGSDEDGQVCEAFGIWVLKKLYGREYMGIERASFLIDEHGKISAIWRKVKVKGHIEEVLKTAQGS